MNINEAYHHLLQLTSRLYGDREGQSVARLVFEDALDIRNVRRESPISEEDLLKIKVISEKLKEGEPIQYALGQAHFYGLQLQVAPSVLIPRPETEELVYWILEDHKKNEALKVLDIGTGSGCIPLALKKNRPHWSVSALDASNEALEIARTNAQNLELTIQFIHLDFLNEKKWTDLPVYDLIVSNPPYIPHEEAHLMPDQVLNFEPVMALFVANEHPLIFYEKIARFGLSKLNSEGKIYVETNEYNAPEVAEVFKTAGYGNVVLEKDMQGKNRMVRAGY